MTWTKRLEDVPAYATGTYPQKADNSQGDIFVGLVNQGQNARAARASFQPVAKYAEELLVGYRWYDCKDVEVAYPFGHGLSYATFQYSNLKVTPTLDGFDVSFTIANNTQFEAEEVAQVYVSRPTSSIERPVKELKGFQRVPLKRGENKTVTIPLRRSDLCHWDEAAQTWMLEPGEMTVLVGGSSAQLPLSQTTIIK